MELFNAALRLAVNGYRAPPRTHVDTRGGAGNMYACCPQDSGAACEQAMEAVALQVDISPGVKRNQ
jgi:hypothetical protein